MTFRIGIIGEGVVGISTALAIKRAIPGAKLSVFSDRPFSETTSFGPAGIFRCDSALPRYQKWASKTFQFWEQLEKEQNPMDTGVQMVSGHIQSDNRALLENQEKAMGDIVYNFRWMTSRELSSIFPNPSKYGIHFTTFAAEGRRYVPWLRAQLAQMDGVEFLQKKVESMEQLAGTGDFSVVINCAGLGAGKVAGDDESIFPNRGVGIEVLAPGHSTHFSYQDLYTFCLPMVGDRLLLGTLRQDNRWDTEITQKDRDDMWQRLLALKPALKNAQVLGEWCGLRPMRPEGVRLEQKIVENGNGRRVQMIHNYGHSSNGFLLSWGCAHEVVELIEAGKAGKSHL